MYKTKCQKLNTSLLLATLKGNCNFKSVWQVNKLLFIDSEVHKSVKKEHNSCKLLSGLYHVLCA